MGLGQNLLDTPTLRSGAFVSPNVVAHAATGVAATDRAMLIEAIGDTPVGGWLYLPNNGDTFYAIDQTITVNNSMRITGGGVLPLWGSQSQGFDTINAPSVSPYLTGTVLEVVTPGIDAIAIPAIGATVDLADFGILFGTSGGQFTNTGRGIVATPPTNGLSNGLDNGIMRQLWRNVCVFGQDGNHYAFEVTNSLYGTMQHCSAYGGGLLHLICNGYQPSGGSQAFYGGMLIDHFHGVTFVGGTAHACLVDNQKGHVNGILWNRPQFMVMTLDTFPGVTAPTSAQMLYEETGAGSPYMSFMQTDWETTVGSNFAPGSAGNPRFLDYAGIYTGQGYPNSIPAGGSALSLNAGYQLYVQADQGAGSGFYTMNDGPTGQLEGYYDDGSRQKVIPKMVIQAPAITAAAGAGAGTTPPAPVVTNCNDARGTITFGTGTVPTAGNQVDVTFGKAWTASGASPAVIITAANAATAALGLYVSASSTTGFTVACQTAPTASEANTVYAFTYMVMA